MIKLGFIQKAIGDGDYVFRPIHHLLVRNPWDFVNVGKHYEMPRYRFVEELRQQDLLSTEADLLFTSRKQHYEVNERGKFLFGTPNTEPVICTEERDRRGLCFPPALPGDELETLMVTYASKPVFRNPNIGIILD